MCTFTKYSHQTFILLFTSTKSEWNELKTKSSDLKSVKMRATKELASWEEVITVSIVSSFIRARRPQKTHLCPSARIYLSLKCIREPESDCMSHVLYQQRIFGRGVNLSLYLY